MKTFLCCCLLTLALCRSVALADGPLVDSETELVKQAPEPAAEASATKSVSIRWQVDTKDAADRVVVVGLPNDWLRRIAGERLDEMAWRDIFRVGVARGDGDPSPMLGTWHVEDSRVAFEPRFPLRPGTTYRAVFQARVSQGGETSDIVVRGDFQRPSDVPKQRTRVAAIYPSAGILPENQLKFYIHFSAPMSRGDAYGRIALYDATGKKIDFPFLELGEELWGPNGSRFTLFFDPGRIKRGLKPREIFGPALVEGSEYTLVVSRDWTDARGFKLAAPARKTFRVVAPDDRQPQTANWRITPPATGTRGRLVVVFDEPLDHAMLSRVLTIQYANGETVRGQSVTGKGETEWSFIPEKPWQGGNYSLKVDTALEDLAGNSIGRPFEIDIFESVSSSDEAQFVDLPFVVAKSPADD